MSTLTAKLVPTLAVVGLMLQSAPVMAQGIGGDFYAGGNAYGGYGAPAGNYNATPAATPNYQRGRICYVPAGLTMPVTLQTAVSTDVARPGDTVQATLSQNVNLGDSVIPAGSTVIGNVTDAKSGGFLGRSGMLTFKFNRLRLPNGQEVPMSAHIVGNIGKYAQIGNQSDTFKGETWRTKAGQATLRTAVGAGTGAALGTAIGAIAGVHGMRGRSIGRGAWSGAAIGGGLGLADSLLLRKGRNVTISSGQQMQIQLDAPMQVSQSVQMGAF
jgi:hypothetical protein